jgi:hypothetical protein
VWDEALITIKLVEADSNGVISFPACDAGAEVYVYSEDESGMVYAMVVKGEDEMRSISSSR